METAFTLSNFENGWNLIVGDTIGNTTIESKKPKIELPDMLNVYVSSRKRTYPISIVSTPVKNLIKTSTDYISQQTQIVYAEVSSKRYSLLKALNFLEKSSK